MTKEEVDRIGKCLWCIACGISDETYQNIKPWLDEIGEIALKYKGTEDE